MMKKMMQGAAALVLVGGIFAATAQQAAAGGRHHHHHGGGGVAAGLAIGTILGLGIAGAYAGPRYADDGPACYKGPRQCDYVGRTCWFNRYGERVCREGEYRCWRPTVCD